jgi:hypothetical protein
MDSKATPASGWDAARPGSRTRRLQPSAWARDVVAPLVALALAALVLAAAGLLLPSWALMGALAGYSLSGSV